MRRAETEPVTPQFACDAVRLVFAAIAETAQGSPENTAILIWRIAGLSTAEIGKLLGISRQATAKRLRALIERSPMLADILHRPSYAEYITPPP